MKAVCDKGGIRVVLTRQQLRECVEQYLLRDHGVSCKIAGIASIEGMELRYSFKTASEFSTEGGAVSFEVEGAFAVCGGGGAGVVHPA